jgi:ParB/RepB/Spo0J family partition protein
MEHRRIPLSLIDRPANAHRIEITEESITELAKDIRDNDLTNPICVRQQGERFEIIAGDRRYHAVKYLGWPVVMCKDFGPITDEQCEKIRLSENIQREQLSPFEEAIQITQLYALNEHDTDRVAKACNRSKAWVAQRRDLFNIPLALQPLVHNKSLSIGAALALAKIDIDKDRDYYTRLAMLDGCSVAVLERWIADYHTQRLTQPEGDVTMPTMPEPGQPIIVYLACNLCDEPADTRTRAAKFVCIKCQEQWDEFRAVRRAIANLDVHIEPAAEVLP